MAKRLDYEIVLFCTAAQRRSKKDEKGISMKKRIASIVCAAMLMLALPTLAWAAPSPSGQTASVNGTSITISGAEGITVAPAAGPASNVPAGAQVACSYEVTGTLAAGQTLTLIFNVGADNAGRVATIYIQHNDGTTETQTATVAADGTISITVDKLSIYTVVLGDKAEGAAAATTTADTSAKSPATGVDMGVVAGGSAIALCGAGVVAVALRKKVTE